MAGKSPILMANGKNFTNDGTYQAGASSTRTKNWVTSSSGPNSAIRYNLQNMRDRSRYGYRNNPWLWSAIDRLVSNEVGVGVTLRSRSDNEEFATKANSVWDETKGQLDPEGVLNFGGLQNIAVTARRTAGEVFIRRRRRRLNTSLAVPFQIQILAAEYVPHDKNENLKNGNKIRAGIEFNKSGQRVAYWFYRDHPYDTERNYNFDKLVRVPARDVIHHYVPSEPGAIRGIPDSVQSIIPANTFDKYEDAELVRKEARAPFTGFLTRQNYTDQDYMFDPFTGEPLDREGAVPDVAVSPGTILQGLPGETLDLFDGDKVGTGFSDYTRSVLLKVAAGHGVPYELMTGDWEKVNDRLVRAILNEFRRKIEAAQDHLLIFQLCNGVWGWFVEAGILSGKLNAPDFFENKHSYIKCHARPHGWAYQHPLQDAQAKKIELEIGTNSNENIVDRQPGPSVDELHKQRLEDKARFNQLEEA